ncbi:exodeoxyribonuclease III [Acetobacterium woodii]|uniref:Exodeoxyribonuclease III n=1 Tax=Acetobacterium woodii (strain ATCC 29683 / DSM 1030 / JCM 2381 / KCTC 1655 / WB1) TaxID=931626 RepID=H6LB88_ACEWD|nr:exodeoxyribonuclease III [Acetobacterium woodii]AFA47640.1 exodeoxyribonuclease III [Acetobacterium woodii DSM 1030]
MKIISWNVNGIRAAEKKGFLTFIEEVSPDLLCIQETKAHDHQLEASLLDIPGYFAYFHSGEKKGYSGTAVYYKQEPLAIRTGLSDATFNNEGRTIIMEYPDFILYNVYFPNGQKDDERLNFKMAFNQCLQNDIQKLLDAKKNVIVCGDINIAHQEIDLKNPKENSKRSGFLPEERAWIDDFLSIGMVDSWRVQHPEEVKYSWWSYRFNARAHNAGWRIDSFFVSEPFMSRVDCTDILNDVLGSDHCPIVLTLKP